MNKITLLIGCVLLFSSLLAQEPVLPAAVIQENDTAEVALPDSVAEAMTQVETPAEPVTPVPLPPEIFTPESTQQEPAQPVSAPRRPVPEALQPPEEVLPVLVASQKAKMKPSEITHFGQMIYWKSLTPSEKKVFLYAYLYHTYEISEQVKQDKNLKSCAKQFQKQIADPVFDVFAQLNESQKDDLIFWIDKFYRIDSNKDQPFGEALRYASEKMKAGS
ncbi:MAG TPA: hypothetical protein P5268_02355 [Candidatus Marinimicrobia bacterium]|mgnify:CR=1 FL=1|nr:hypothetical protein [Candidatus Neomarinimicrobiota bacterium]HRS52012.1 hypothetical protein [Candidatus Neomarinimicrobiota bacterium]HRU91859.1 hypothetical protein [Candidatus Neomarinimicrobiota bacterium]